MDMKLCLLTEDEIAMIEKARAKAAKEKIESNLRDEAIAKIQEGLIQFQSNGGNLYFKGGQYINIHSPAVLLFGKNNKEITVLN